MINIFFLNQFKQALKLHYPLNYVQIDRFFFLLLKYHFYDQLNIMSSRDIKQSMYIHIIGLDKVLNFQ